LSCVIDVLVQIRVPVKIAVKSKDVVVDIQKRVSSVGTNPSGLQLF